jgi:hypothetical protein
MPGPAASLQHGSPRRARLSSSPQLKTHPLGHTPSHQDPAARCDGVNGSLRARRAGQGVVAEHTAPSGLRSTDVPTQVMTLSY